jgi:tetratricopeptide (TPR) repeat protein
MELQPMDRDQLAGLARARLGGESVDSALLDELMEVSGGNPLLATEHLRSLSDAGCLRLDEDLNLSGTGARRPRASVRIRSFVRDRLEQLDEDDLRLLALAATLGRCFEVADVAGLAALGEGQVLSCFDRAERLGLLRPCHDPLRFELTASYLREGLLQRISDGLRATFHSAVAELYRRAGDRAMAAVHLESAGRTDEAMEERLAAAGELEASGLIHVAAGHLEAAVRLLERLSGEGGGLGRMARAALHAADVHMKAGMHRRARGLALKAAEAADAKDAGELRARALLAAAAALRVLDDPGRALVELRRISAPTPEVAAALGLEKADVLTRIGRPGRAEAELDSLRNSLPDAMRYRALHKRALVELCRLRMARALDASRAALKAAESAGEREALWWLRHDYAELCLYCGHVTEAGKSASAALSAAEDVLSLWGSIWSLIMLSRASLRALRPSSALESARRAEDLAERTDDPETIAGAQLAASLVLAACGRSAEAAERLHRASCWGVIDPLVITYVRLRRGLAAGSAGCSEEARLALAALDSRRQPLELASSSLICGHDIRLLACEATLEEDPEDALARLRAMDLEDYPRGRLWRARLEAAALHARGDDGTARGVLRRVLSDGRTRTETLERLLLYRSAGELLPEGAARLRRLSRRLRAGCRQASGRC